MALDGWWGGNDHGFRFSVLSIKLFVLWIEEFLGRKNLDQTNDNRGNIQCTRDNQSIVFSLLKSFRQLCGYNDCSYPVYYSVTTGKYSG